MKHDFIIFGGTGQQGRICARDLLESGYSVLLVGRDPKPIDPLLKRYRKALFKLSDLHKEKNLVKLIKDSGADVVINCAELNFNVQIMDACIKAGKHYTDLGGLHTMTIEQYKRDAAFKRIGKLALTGCGSTPGITNVMASYVAGDFDTISSIDLGFAWDSNMKHFVVPYSMKSIFEEFTEEPVIFKNGSFARTDRLHCQGTMKFKDVGEQTVYCIVHSEVYTFAKYFKDKGLKEVKYYAGFPAHSFNVIQVLMNLGFSSRQPVDVRGSPMRPIDLTVSLLKKIRPPQGYKETENLWTIVRGTKRGKKAETALNCIVKTVDGWEEAGSNINTGRTISIMSQMVKRGLTDEAGVYAPEVVIPHGEFFAELAKRKMYVYQNNKRIN